jgi:hypothetical protein
VRIMLPCGEVEEGMGGKENIHVGGRMLSNPKTNRMRVALCKVTPTPQPTRTTVESPIPLFLLE